MDNLNVLESDIDEQIETEQPAAEQAASGNKIEFVKKPVYDFFKRAFDIVCSALALIVLSPLILVITLMICVKDFGNPFYTQDRVGKDEKIFKMLKFRSMYKNADKLQEELRNQNNISDVSVKLENDPRVIKGMNFIRTYSIDELMQLVNILKGDMSIIGPRPLPVYEYDEVKDNPEYKLRYKVKQGLSCYWQIERTKDTTFDERMKMDNKYVEERSFATDIKIIFRTIGVVLGHKNY